MNKTENIIFDRINFWTKELIKLWRNNQFTSYNLSERDYRDISESVKELSNGLIGDRALIGKKYLADFSTLGAYLLYYWPVSYAQTRKILFDSQIKGQNALDLGAGPGPCSIALLDHGFKHVTSYEKIRNSALILKKLSGLTKGNVILKEADLEKNSKAVEGKYDLIIMGHFINELWSSNENKINLRSEFIQNLLNNLRKDGKICIIEPALTKTSRDLIKLRNYLIKSNITVVSPCINKGVCKIINENENTTCHSEFNWKINPVISKISRMAGIKKDKLKFSYLLLQKNAHFTLPDHYLVVSDKLISKSGKARFFVCGKEGRVSISLNKKNMENGNNIFLKLKRGDKIKIIDPEITENGFSIKKESSIIKI